MKYKIQLAQQLMDLSHRVLKLERLVEGLMDHLAVTDGSGGTRMIPWENLYPNPAPKKDQS